MGQRQQRESLRGSNVHDKLSVSFSFLLGMCALANQQSASSSVITSGGRYGVGFSPPFGEEDGESNSPQGSSTKAWENEVCENLIDLRWGVTSCRSLVIGDGLHWLHTRAAAAGGLQIAMKA